MSKSKPQRFGPYIILEQIGDGGMAEIFLAKMQGYSGFEKLLALKRIHSRYSQNQTFAKMLIHEAKLAASLNHFNVVQVHDLGEIDGQVFIAMEYVKGRDLAGVLSNTYRRKEKLPLNLALCVATEFMTGLDYAHRMRAADGTPNVTYLSRVRTVDDNRVARSNQIFSKTRQNLVAYRLKLC